MIACRQCAAPKELVCSPQAPAWLLVPTLQHAGICDQERGGRVLSTAGGMKQHHLHSRAGD